MPCMRFSRIREKQTIKYEIWRTTNLTMTHPTGCWYRYNSCAWKSFRHSCLVFHGFIVCVFLYLNANKRAYGLKMNFMIIDNIDFYFFILVLVKYKGVVKMRLCGHTYTKTFVFGQLSYHHCMHIIFCFIIITFVVDRWFRTFSRLTSRFICFVF